MLSAHHLRHTCVIARRTRGSGRQKGGADRTVTLLSPVICPAGKYRGVSEGYGGVACGKDGFATVRTRFFVTRSAPVGDPRRPSPRDRPHRMRAKIRKSKGVVAHSREPHPR